MTDDATIRNKVGGAPFPPLATDSTEIERTLRVGSGKESAPLPVKNREFVLRGIIYNYVRSLSDNSGEAQVFLVERDDREYVLKIYYPGVDIKKDTLKVILNLDFEMVVRLYDYGKMFVDGSNRYYELMEYLKGGTLNDLNLNGDIDAFRRIALQGAAALSCCHNNNIIHKDIKPSNFFFRDKDHTEVVLGDFGISSVMTDGSRLHRTTQARTPLYAAPEMYNDVIDGEVEITPAADFYSFGVMLLTLWLGKGLLNANERIIMKRKNEGRLPGIKDLPERVRMIVQGLTAINPDTRWTYDEVERWFLGESPKVDIASPYLRYRSFVVDPERNLVADNVHELVPMLVDNERLACVYLYSGKIKEWLETCGNTKLSAAVDDIVKNRYPANQEAGLMLAAYVMDPLYTYTDIRGNKCDDIHSVAISLLNYAAEYASLLRNPYDRVWMYLEAHLRSEVDRMRGYFADGAERDRRKDVLRVVYEIDHDIPFMSRYPSSTLPEIVRCFGNKDISEDDWRSVTDGRLLSWMSGHVDVMACESLRIMTEGQQYSKLLAYKVLYNLDRNAAYDLRDADTPHKIGEILAGQLVEWQNIGDEEFAGLIAEYADPDGRFQYYAHLHGWFEQLDNIRQCFSLDSKENRERLGAYDLRTAAYRACRILGVVPVYRLPNGKILSDGLDVDNRYRSEIISEMRSGCFAQWLSVFYHEDPSKDFVEAYSYEHTLERWVEVLGGFDMNQPYYKRFVAAKKETASKYDNVRTAYRKAQAKAAMWRIVFYGLCALWILLLIVCGVSDREELLSHPLIAIGIPVGGVSALIVWMRAFFRGYGFVLSCLWGGMGALSSMIPLWILRFTESALPGMFIPAVIAITFVYMAVCYYTDFKVESKEDARLIDEVLDDDIKSSLIEPLYYTFKTKSYRYKGSKFGVLDDVQQRIRSVAGENVMHYILWSIMVALLVLEMIVYSPKLMNVQHPWNSEAESGQTVGL